MPDEPRGSRRSERRRIVVKWYILVPVMALTWAAMAYAIYYLVGSARY